MRYKVCYAEIKDGIVELPEGAVPLKVSLMLTGKFSSSDTNMCDGICYLMPIDK